MRIVAGRWKGRKLVAPAGAGTRPTSDRVREALFDAMLSRLGTLEGSAVLDAFAGTGALGLETLSRGASRAVFVESDRAALAALRRNLTALGVGDEARVLEGDVRGPALERAMGLGPFALLLLDPPYRIDQSVPLGVVERTSSALSDDALVVWEHAAGREPALPSGWRAIRTHRYGDTAVTFIERDDEGTV